MELTNEFEVGTEVDEAWRILTDVERIAPCLPGAELREIDGDEYRGVVKVKVGPITAEYRGAAHFVELDEAAHRAVLRAEGREARGQGNASATITALLEPSDKGTKVSVDTDLSITGKVAQFGRGVLADVSQKLLGQFVDNLETMVLAGGNEPAEAETKAEAKPEEKAKKGGKKSGPSSNGTEADSAEAAATAAAATEAAEDEASTVRKLEPRPVEPVDLVDVAGASIAKRVLPVIGVAVVLAVLAAVLRRVLR